MKEITLKLTIDETNMILEALGSQSFNRVYSLIAKIQAEASGQLNGKQEMANPEIKNEK